MKAQISFFVKRARLTVLSLINFLSGFLGLTVFVLLVLDLGFHLSDENKAVFSQLQHGILLYYLVDIGIRLFFERRRFRYFMMHPTDLMVGIPYITFLPTVFSSSYIVMQLVLFGVVMGRVSHLGVLFNWLKFKPAQVFLIGFLFVIFCGSLLLSLPISTVEIQGIPFLDALFTSFSAVCVTGLVVNDIGVTFSLFGQSVIMILVQIGGFGIMSFSVLLALLLHKKVSQSASQEFQHSYSTFNLNDTFKTIAFIFRFTFLFELLGALLLFVSWYSDFPNWKDALFHSFFHSISAFCNAGFSLFPNSLESYAFNVPIILIFSGLIIVGGLGFPVLYNLTHMHLKIGGEKRLKTQTKIALIVTGLLLVFGTIFIFFGEYNYSFQQLSIGDKWLTAFFQSVSSRTAGFNSVNISFFHPATLTLMMVWMVIGASPGSTGGGIKTTTFGLMMASFWTTIKEARRVDIGGRTIKSASIYEGFALFLLAIIIILIFFSTILFLEDLSFLSLLFETVSAFGTVGYSLGVTSELSNWGKILIMVLMFVGRIGPLSVAFALSQPRPEVNYAYPEERIVIV